MSRRDTYHQAVRNALSKEGWAITDDPLHLRQGAIDLYVDLGAERILGAQRGDERIAVEIKSFVGTSDISELYTALGQFLIYRLALGRQEPERVLYVAVPEDTWQGFFSLPFVQEVRQLHQMKIIVFDRRQEVIERWIKS